MNKIVVRGFVEFVIEENGFPFSVCMRTIQFSVTFGQYSPNTVREQAIWRSQEHSLATGHSVVTLVTTRL